MPTQELLIPQAEVPERREPTLMEIISAVAANPQVDVAKMEALLSLKERMEAREAEREFNAAMARLLPKIPRIGKHGKIKLVTKEGVFKGEIPYATYEDIDAVIRPLETAEGFTRSFVFEPADNGVIVTCILCHTAGHERRSQMKLPPDPGPGRNGLQAIGSAHSYGKRYLTNGIYNLITEGEDDDGHRAHAISEEQVQSIEDLMTEIGGTNKQSAQYKQLESGFLKYMGVSHVRLIQDHDYRKAITALEAKRRGAK